MTLAEKLHRLISPYKQTHVAKAAGVTTMTLWNIMSGTTKAPSIATVKRLADALGVEVGFLIDDKAQWPLKTLGAARGLRLEIAATAA